MIHMSIDDYLSSGHKVTCLFYGQSFLNNLCFSHPDNWDIFKWANNTFYNEINCEVSSWYYDVGSYCEYVEIIVPDLVRLNNCPTKPIYGSDKKTATISSRYLKYPNKIYYTCNMCAKKFDFDYIAVGFICYDCKLKMEE